MATSSSQKQQILLDLIKHIQEQGGIITSNQLAGFYTKHPSYRALIKNVVSFCKEYPDHISVGPSDGPHLQLKVKMPSQVSPARASSSTTSNSLISATSMQVAAQLAIFLGEHRGGSMLACQLHQYYAEHPSHKSVINKLPVFCAEHPGLLHYAYDGGGGKLYLPKHCCLFLQGRCEKTSTHQGFLHSQVPTGAAHCQHGKQCTAGHWAKIEAQAKGLKGKGSGKGTGKSTGKNTGKGQATPSSIAANLALFIHQMGGSIHGSILGEYYKLHPSHKAIISDAGARAFCQAHDGLLVFEGNTISLASYCCYFLRDCCPAKKDHKDGRQHVKPETIPMCNFREKCLYGHWQAIEQKARGTAAAQTPSVPVATAEPICGEIEVPVSQIRWCHDSIRVVFQDKRLVATMLKELLDGNLLTHQIPQIDVLENDNTLYAWSGNRRLWVLREFEKLTQKEVRVRVKKRRSKLPKSSPKFSTTNEGCSVTFFTHNRKDHFPSMSFALAALSPASTPSLWDVELGKTICGDLKSLPLGEIRYLGEVGYLQETMPRIDLKEYLLQKPYLFTVSSDATDNLVSLTSCLDCLEHLARVSLLNGSSTVNLDVVEKDLLKRILSRHRQTHTRDIAYILN